MSDILGAQTPTVEQIGMAIEDPSGVFETAPTVYMVLGGEATPKPAKPSTKRRTSGNLDPVLPYRGPETYSMPLETLPLVDGNGLGELLLMTMGADDTDQLGASAAYEHSFSRQDLIKTATIWLHNPVQDSKIRLCSVDSWALELTKDGDVKNRFEIKGANLEDCSDFGSPSYIDQAAARPQQLSSFQARLEFGEPGAVIRDTWENFKLDMKRNIVFGRNAKDGGHPAGSSSPQMVVSGNVDTEVTLAFLATNWAEVRRWRQGVDTLPTAVRQTDAPGLNKIRISVYGNVIADGLNIEPDINNAGTTTATIQGTYSGATTLTLWEIKIKQGTPDQYAWRKTIGGVWTDWAAWANITAGPDTLSDGVTVTFSSTTNGLDGDRFYAASHYRRMLRATLPTMVFDDLGWDKSDDFRRKTAKLYHTSGPSDDFANKPSVDVWNTKTGAYA